MTESEFNPDLEWRVAFFHNTTDLAPCRVEVILAHTRESAEEWAKGEMRADEMLATAVPIAKKNDGPDP
jgi:hypothetical protein